TIVVQESDPKGRTAGPGGPSSGGPRPPGPRPPGAGMHNSGTGGSGFRSGPGGPPRHAGGPPRPGGGYQNRTAAPPSNRNFGPPASPAAERNRVYQEKKDRLKPYKRDHFDFRSELSEEEERENKRKQS